MIYSATYVGDDQLVRHAGLFGCAMVNNDVANFYVGEHEFIVPVSALSIDPRAHGDMRRSIMAREYDEPSPELTKELIQFVKERTFQQLMDGIETCGFKPELVFAAKKFVEWIDEWKVLGTVAEHDLDAEWARAVREMRMFWKYARGWNVTG